MSQCDLMVRSCHGPSRCTRLTSRSVFLCLELLKNLGEAVLLRQSSLIIRLNFTLFGKWLHADRRQRWAVEVYTVSDWEFNLREREWSVDNIGPKCDQALDALRDLHHQARGEYRRQMVVQDRPAGMTDTPSLSRLSRHPRLFPLCPPPDRLSSTCLYPTRGCHPIPHRSLKSLADRVCNSYLSPPTVSAIHTAIVIEASCRRRSPLLLSISCHCRGHLCPP